MAGLPSVIHNTTKVPDSQIQRIADLVAQGKTPNQIAKALYPTNKQAYLRTRTSVREIIATDPRITDRLFKSARVAALVGLVPAMEGLARRAAKGNVPAQKLLLEVSGVYNPRVRHEHKGDIKISVDLPRPKFVDSEAEEVE